LLSERPALRAALRELLSLASTAHITKGTTWALGAGETLAATGRPLGRPARTANSSHPAGTSNTANSTGSAYPTDTPNTASPAGSTDATDAGRGPHGATRHRHLRTAGQSDGAVGCAREVCPVAGEVCLEPV